MMMRREQELRRQTQPGEAAAETDGVQTLQQLPLELVERDAGDALNGGSPFRVECAGDRDRKNES
jgi:hypothetical protein